MLGSTSIDTAKGNVPVRRSEPLWPTTMWPATSWPIGGIWRDMNRFMEDFSRLEPSAALQNRLQDFVPRIDMSEDDEVVRLVGELPGMTEKDVEVILNANSVTVRGEKRAEKEEKRRNYYTSERFFGSFERTLALPSEIEREKVAANFKNGILTVILPKNAKVKAETRKVAIKAE